MRKRSRVQVRSSNSQHRVLAGSSCRSSCYKVATQVRQIFRWPAYFFFVTLPSFTSPTELNMADTEDAIISEVIADLARLPAMMIVGDTHQMSSTRSEPFHNHPQAPSTQSTPTPSQYQDAPSHLQFHGVPSQYMPQQDGEHPYDHHNSHLHPEESHSTAAIPPPSPRLEPTDGSTLSLNGSVASSPSRIKVRDLGHIQSFASEEVLTRSRHPSRHSLKGRLAGGQQYEISAMPVADIIEMVAGLLTKITTTVSYIFAFIMLHANMSYRTTTSMKTCTGIYLRQKGPLA